MQLLHSLVTYFERIRDGYHRLIILEVILGYPFKLKTSKMIPAHNNGRSIYVSNVDNNRFRCNITEASKGEKKLRHS